MYRPSKNDADLNKKQKDKHIGEGLGVKSNQQWEQHFSMERGFGNDPAGAFLPHPGKERAQPHRKINECDH